MIAWGYWISIWAANAAIAVAFAGYMAFLIPALGSRPAYSAATALVAIWLLTAVNARGVRSAGWVALVTTILKVLPLLAIGTVGFLYVDLANFRPFNVSGGPAFSAVTACAALTLWALLGLEYATIPADNVEAPERTIPRATILGTVLAAIIYVLSTGAVMGLVPRDVLAGSTAPFADAALGVWGGATSTVVAVGAAISAFGALNGWLLLAGQIPRAAALDGLFPKIFGRLSGHGVPLSGLTVSSGLSSAVLLANYTRGLVAMFTFIIACWRRSTRYCRTFSAPWPTSSSTRKSGHSGAGVPRGHSLVAGLAFVYSAWAVMGAGRDAIYWGTLLLLAGIPVFVWLKGDASKETTTAHP